MSPLLICAIAVILFFLFPYIFAYLIALQMTFRPVTTETASLEQIPLEIKALMQPWLDRLASYGFQIVGCQLVDSGLINHPPHWGIVLQHSSQQIFAGLMVKPTPDPNYPVICDLSSYWKKTSLITINVDNFNTFSESDFQKTNHLDKATVSELWLSHQAFLESICPQTSLAKMTLEEWSICERQTVDSLITSRIHKKEIYWIDKEQKLYRQNPWIALKLAINAVKRMSQNSQFNNTSKVRSDNLSFVDDEELVELEVSAFLAGSKKSTFRLSRQQKTWLLIISFALFVIVYATHFKPIQLLIFVLTLLLHEMGHILAMRAFGYRDTTMLFIPWLGALAIGKKERASIAEKVWISLAGPLPGLILGIIFAIAFPSNDLWLRDASFILIFVNLFNLLPIYPLDGGQIVNLLIFSRHPYLVVVFQSIGVLLLGAIGLMQPFMLVFALLVAIGIPHNYKLARLQFELKDELQNTHPGDRETLVRSIFRHLSTQKYGHLPSSKKTQLVNSLLDRQEEHRSKWLSRLGLAIFYLVSILGGFVGGLYALIPNMQVWLELPQALVSNHRNDAKRYSQKQIDRANRKLAQNPQDAAAYLQRGMGYYGLQQYPIALNDLNRAIALDPNNFEAYRLRSSLRRVMGDSSGAIADLKRSDELLNLELDNSDEN
jgi:Zn-dependent protease